jgi:isochorismate synthase
MTAEPPPTLHSRPLGSSFDLLAAYPGHGGFFMERGGLGVAGSSGPAVAAQTAEKAGIQELSAQVLGELRRLHRDGPLPVAVGVVGFDARLGAMLRIPDVAARRGDDGSTWLFELGVGDREPLGVDVKPVTGGSPHEAFSEVRERPSVDVYAAAVSRAVSEIRDGALRKVVLARALDVEAGRRLDPRRLLHHLRAVEPGAYAFAVPIGVGASLVGASPELLVSRRGRRVRSNPLAGSAPRSGDPEVDHESARVLAGSAKDREEHAIVVEAMAEVLEPLCDELSWDPEPVLHETANVWHLSTRFDGTLREKAPSVLDLVASLHPTPAVCGTPSSEALELIRELEPFDRGRYAGAVGWIDAAGDGDWAIALRCAELEGDRATLFAGAGIVADSVPEREVDETDRKFRAFLDALRWG